MTMRIYEFLYRGPIPAEKRDAAWHVIIAEDVTSFGETKTITKEPLNPEQAEALGFPLSTIFADLNAQALKQADAASADAASADAAAEAASAAATKATEERDAAMALAVQAIAQRDAAIAAAEDAIAKSADFAQALRAEQAAHEATKIDAGKALELATAQTVSQLPAEVDAESDTR